MERTSITLTQDQWIAIYNILGNIQIKMGDVEILWPIALEIRRNIKLSREEPKKEDNKFNA